jgi:hypothetical protein
MSGSASAVWQPSGIAISSASERFGSGFPFEPRPWAKRGFGRVRSVEASWIPESPTEQLSEAAFSSVPKHFRAGILFELGFRTVHLAASGLPRCRGTSVCESPFGGDIRGRLLRGAEALWIEFTLPFGPPTTIGFAIVRNTKDALERDFTKGK